MPQWRDWLGLNSSTIALLATIFFVTASTELWSPLVPEYIKQLRGRFMAGEMLTILLIGGYGFYRDALEAVNYYLGGAISGRLNTRRSLLLFNVFPLIGLAVLAAWDSTVGVFVAIPLIFVWDSIAGPAIITVVGDALPSDRRTIAFSIQAILRRISRIFAYGLSALLIWRLGTTGGVRSGAGLAVVLVLGAMVIQYRFMRTASRDTHAAIHRPRQLLRRFDPQLRRLLAADIFARWAESLAGPFIILYCIPILSARPALGAAAYTSVLLVIQAVTNIMLYMLIGALAARSGFAKKPYIGLTFVFFALFPLSVIVFGEALGAIGLVLAFVVGGMREIGEPARKAMIADLVPPDVKTQAVGLYWSVRSAAVMWASPVGALLWILGEYWRPGTGPWLTFSAASVVGLIGAIGFFVRFGHTPDADAQQPPSPGSSP